LKGAVAGHVCRDLVGIDDHIHATFCQHGRDGPAMGAPEPEALLVDRTAGRLRGFGQGVDLLGAQGDRAPPGRRGQRPVRGADIGPAGAEHLGDVGKKEPVRS
jgi:hypothetical protein